MATLPLIVFDVNETLLDLQTMEPTFERIFGDRSGPCAFGSPISSCIPAALTVAGCYVPFTDIGAAVMKMLADIEGIKIDDADKDRAYREVFHMPPHREDTGRATQVARRRLPAVHPHRQSA